MKTWILSLALVLAACGEASVPPAPGDMARPEGCGSDSECAAPTPRCNLNSRKCVACLPDNDNCPKGQRCVATNGSFSCSSSCLVDADCPRSDAGNPTACCSGACIDTTSDIQSCGHCGATCLAPPNATAGCSGGLCGIGQCNLGFLDCDRAAANGCEINTNIDDRNCGACGKVCTAGANQSLACTNGACTTACNTGYADCDNDPKSGCEVNTQTDGANCGACGTVCRLANASSVCKAGACVVDACQAGFDDCNGDPKDGCESDLKQDINHCGNCMGSCMVASAVPICRMGACGIASCIMGFANCDSLYLNGCEVSLQDDNKNCGACGTKCTGANSVQSCAKGVCNINGCTPDFSDCDGKPETGCEINVAGDAMNCGGCGTVCPVPANASAACANGKCGVGQCKFGFADCNNDPKDGCETDLQTIQNCGNCGKACAVPANATAACNVGVCGIGKCNNLFGDCDGSAGNGCEKDLSADVVNCGKCGTACSFANAKAACLGGQCGISSCNAGFDDCNKMAGDGCEANVQGDARNCGQCGTVCGGNTPVCMAGVCVQADYKSCQAIVDAGASVGSGLYTIDPDGAGGAASFKIFCEMDTDGGGWEVQAYIRKANQWDWGFYTDNGVVGDVAGGFASAKTLFNANDTVNEKIVIYLNLIENGGSLGKQFMVVRRSDNNAIPYNTLDANATGWSFRDSFGKTDVTAGNVCTHGCGSFRTHGMFHDNGGISWHGTQGGDNGCRDGNNICWMSRGLGCNVGGQRCAFLTGNGEGVIYGVRRK